MEIRFNVYRFREDSIFRPPKSRAGYKAHFSNGDYSRLSLNTAYTDEDMIQDIIAVTRKENPDEIRINTIEEYDISYVGCRPYRHGDLKAIRDLVAENVSVPVEIR